MSEKIALSSPIQSISQPVPGDGVYSPPVDIVPLPSKGRIYPPESPLGNAETIEIRSMTAADEDILTSAALLKQGKAVSTLLKSCLVNKLIDPEELVIGDRNAILISLRISGYGPEYTVPVQCPSCDAQEEKHTFDLTKLELKPLGQEPISSGVNAFNFMLPVSNKEVVFKLMTSADDREVDATIERSRKASGGQVDANITIRLFQSIISIGGEKDRNKLSQIIRRLPVRDSRALRTKIDEIVPGMDMTQNFVCRACGEGSEVDVPMGAEFFWPSR